VIAAAIQEEPPALLVGARADVSKPFGDQRLGRDVSDDPQWSIQRGVDTFPYPLEPVGGVDQAPVDYGPPVCAVERPQIARTRRRAGRARREKAVDRFPEGECASEDTPCIRRSRGCDGTQTGGGGCVDHAVRNRPLDEIAILTKGFRGLQPAAP